VFPRQNFENKKQIEIKVPLMQLKSEYRKRNTSKHLLKEESPSICAVFPFFLFKYYYFILFNMAQNLTALVVLFQMKVKFYLLTSVGTFKGVFLDFSGY